MKKIVIYGTAQNAEYFYTNLSFEGAEVVAVVDGNANRVGELFCGIDICSFDSLKKVLNDIDYYVVCSESFDEICKVIQSYDVDLQKVVHFSCFNPRFDNVVQFEKSVIYSLLSNDARVYIRNLVEEKCEKRRLAELGDRFFDSNNTINDYPNSVYDKGVFSHDELMISYMMNFIVRMPNIDISMTNCFGYKNYVDNGLSMDVIAKYNFPCDCYPVIKCLDVYHLSKPFDVCFDVGANRGIVSCYLAKHSNSVHAFEPSKEVSELAYRNIRLNDANNIIWNVMGVAEAKSSRTFFDYGIDGSGRNSFCYQDDLKPINEFEVKTTTIDDYCSDNNIDKIDVLKIDVEGYEYNVLQGARKMLESHSIEMIIFEISRQINQTVGGSEKMIDELEKEGYFFYDCHNNRVCSDDLRNIIGHMDVVAINKDDKQ